MPHPASTPRFTSSAPRSIFPTHASVCSRRHSALPTFASPARGPTPYTSTTPTRPPQPHHPPALAPLSPAPSGAGSSTSSTQPTASLLPPSPPEWAFATSPLYGNLPRPRLSSITPTP